MASPQVEDGHIDIANTIADKFCSYRLSGQEWQIIWVVLRKTWGWLENPSDPKSAKKRMDSISESQFEQLTGIDRRKCHTLLRKLVAKNVLKRTATQKGGKITVSYGIQTDFDKWIVPPKKMAATQKDGKLPPKRMAKLPPKKAHTKDILKKLSKDNIADFDKSASPENFYKTKSGKKLSGKRLETFNQFWETFNLKQGKAAAADSWLKIPTLTNSLVSQILTAAQIEAERRPALEVKGQTPKWAQGWITGRRWEDEIYQQPKVQQQKMTPEEQIEDFLS
jgi:phage replication O-like protein O